MKAWVCRRYGGPDVLALEERPKPVPKADEVLVQVAATTVSSGDMRVRALKMPRGFGPIARLIFGMRRPRQPILGTDFAGTVAAVGANVTAFRPGDAVVGFPSDAMGCHAEYRVMAVGGLIAPKPALLSFEEAASLLFGGTTALHFLRNAGSLAGKTVLVIGASGAVGSAMVQLARHMGARVTAVTSAANIDLVRSLGAQAVIDYTTRDFSTADERYDVIADAVGASSFAACHPLLNEHGRYLAVAADLAALFARPKGTKRSVGGPATTRREDIVELLRLADAGMLIPVIDTVYDFAQLPQAHAHVDTGRKRGAVVVSVA